MPRTKVQKGFRPRVRSRHPSHSILRASLERLPFRSVVRLGSTTEVLDVDVELNTTEAINNSASKYRMKKCFTNGKVRTADWTSGNTLDSIRTWAKKLYPIVAKSYFGSRGRGNSLIKSETDLVEWAKGRDFSNYIFEKYHNYNREYRLHVSPDGCFYTCRKMLREGTPEKDRWFRNDSNCVWIREENQDFDRPVNWDNIVAECVKALQSCGLDFGACDVRVQSRLDEEGKLRGNPEFIIIEINSAPSFGDITAQRYIEVLPQLLRNKYNNKRK
jgi:carbamoylphosphate synthase large subunit